MPSLILFDLIELGGTQPNFTFNHSNRTSVRSFSLS